MSKPYTKKKSLKSEVLLKRVLHIFKPNYKLSPEDWQIVLDRERAYKKSKEQLVREANKTLGFNFENNIGLPANFNLGKFTVPEGSAKQVCCIPLDQSIADHLLYAKKTFLSSNKKHYKKNEKDFIETREFYASETRYGTVLYLYLEKEKTEKDGTKHYSISLYTVLNGEALLELFRYDSKNNVHYQRFKDGKPTQEKIQVQGPHMHVYDERFSVVFPNSFCHYDVDTLPYNAESIKDQSKFLKKMFNLEPAQNLEIGTLPPPENSPDSKTNITEYLREIQAIRAKKAKKKQKTLEK